MIGARLAKEGVDGQRVFFAAASVACTIAFSQALNDIYDRELDRWSKPWRPLPSGIISLRLAKVVVGSCAVVGVVLGALASPPLALVVLFMCALSWLYSYRLKSTVFIGNLVVAAMASSCVPFGAAMGGLTGTVLAVQGLILAFSLAVESLKTTLDAAGDSAANVKTLATRFGTATGAACAGVFCLIAAIFAIAIFPLASHPVFYAAAIGVTAVWPIIVAAVLLWTRAPEEKVLERSMLLLRIAWLGGILSLFLV